MSAFKILISDAQREYILTALTQCQLQSYFGADTEAREEIDMLACMFAELKDDESNYWVDPATGKRRHMLHGFCL